MNGTGDSTSLRFEKYFTPDEANRMLPLLRAIVRLRRARFSGA